MPATAEMGTSDTGLACSQCEQPGMASDTNARGKIAAAFGISSLSSEEHASSLSLLEAREELLVLG